MTIHPVELRTRYLNKVTSQNGEDGIVAELCARLSLPRTCVEFGAVNGVVHSNCCTLWRDQGWRALLIESDEESFGQLTRNTAGLEAVTIEKAYVEARGATAIAALTASCGFPNDIGVMSIDIDSNDLEVFEAMEHHRLHIVILEFNYELPAWVDYRDPPGALVFRHSAKASLRLARELGYEAACCIGSNLILVNTAHHKLDWLRCGVPIEEMFDEDFRRSRMRNPKIVRSKFTTRGAVYTEPPTALMRAEAMMSDNWRGLRRRRHPGARSAEIPPAVAQALTEAGLYL